MSLDTGAVSTETGNTEIQPAASTPAADTPAAVSQETSVSEERPLRDVLLEQASKLMAPEGDKADEAKEEPKAEGEKDKPARDASGKFAKKDGETPAAEAKPEGEQEPDKKADDDKTKEPPKVEDKFLMAPQSLSAAAKAAWKDAPLALRQEWAKREADVTKGFTQLNDQNRRLSPFGEVAQKYVPIIQRMNMHPADFMDAAYSWQAKFMSDDLNERTMAAIEFLQANGIDPNNMQIQPVDPQVAALKNELATLKRTLGTVAGSVHSREKAESEAAERERSERALSESVNGAMEAFASQHPDFQQLEQQIADKVTSIKSRHPTLDAAATLEWAYTEAKREADAAKRDEADKKRVADEKAAAAAAKARNAVNVRSATPTAPPPSSLKDAYNQVFQKHGMGLIQ